jgi:hypothetical protein
LQCFRVLTLSQSAEVLEAESGFTLSSPAANDFQQAILGGRWNEALGYLEQLGFDMSASPSPVSIKVESSSSAASLNDGSSGNGVTSPAATTPAEQAKFLISQQKYLEQLELGQQKKALATLRSELTPIVKDREVLHTISGCVPAWPWTLPGLLLTE